MGLQVSFIARRMMMLALGVSALALTACSTPVVPYTDPDEADTSWEAYQDCLSSLPANANSNVCNNVGTQSASSATNYINSGLYVDSSGNVLSSTAGTTTVGSSGPKYHEVMPAAELKKSFDAAYKAYLTTVDAKDLAQMTAQWRSIASEGSATASTEAQSN